MHQNAAGGRESAPQRNTKGRSAVRVLDRNRSQGFFNSRNLPFLECPDTSSFLEGLGVSNGFALGDLAECEGVALGDSKPRELVPLDAEHSPLPHPIGEQLN